MSSPVAADLLPSDLPDSAELIAEGRELGRRLRPAVTRYEARHGVISERHYKERCREDGTITYYINLGLKSWPETRDSLGEVWEECQRRDLRVDRVSLTADRRMGLLPAERPGATEETGIMFWTPEDWAGIATEIEVEGIINDHAVGSPASVENACAAIEAGVSYVGNLAQQPYGYPGWSAKDVEQMASTVKAIAVIAAQKEAGVVLDSYIDDGYCASFHDCATSLGWCLMHRRVADELIGAAYSPSYGSTFADPLLKAAYGQAMDAINTSRVPPSLVHGDTNSLDPAFSLDRHAATVTSDILFTIANELAHPTGAAVHATPTTEPIRIPTVEDIVQSLELGNEAERQARRALPLIDWTPVHEVRDRIIAGGRQVYANMLAGLTGMGVDVDDPLQILIATRRLGAERIEELWGAGPADDEYPRGRTPVVASNTLSRATERRQAVLAQILAEQGEVELGGIRVVTASSDIHEYGLDIVVSVLRRFGAEVIDLGTSVDNDLLAAAAAETAADAVGLSTYNGSALSVTEDLMARLRERGLRAEVFIGGRLTQDLGAVKSVDVSDRIESVGAHPCASVSEMLTVLGALRRTPGE
ncbi:MAG: cobalamin-dependent protein [Solirubrobacterales bacterium]